MIVSSVSNFSVKEIASKSGATLWFQLYPTPDRSITSKLLEKKLEKKYAEETEMAKQLTGSVNRAISEAHGLAVNLFQFELNPETLIDSLEKMVSETRAVYKVEIRFTHNDDNPITENITASHLFKITQESVHNAAKHGGAKNISLDLHSDRHEIVLSVRDDGCGFDPSHTNGDGIGLRIMKYRAGMIRATFSIDSEPGKGTLVMLKIPR
jgi:signal transduction histidine kinase